LLREEKGLLSLCAADLPGLGADPSSWGRREPRWNRAFGQLDKPPWTQPSTCAVILTFAMRTKRWLNRRASASCWLV